MKNLYYSLFVLSLFFFAACNTSDTSSNTTKEETKESTTKTEKKSDFVETGDRPTEEEFKKKPVEADNGGYTSKGILGEFLSENCDKMVHDDSGCECSFSIGDPYKGPTIFYSNHSQYGCVKINDEMNVIYDSEIDFEKNFKEFATNENWITLNDNSDVLFFGKTLPEHGYGSFSNDNVVTFLTDVILASEKTITEVPIQNNLTAGMFVREVRDMASDAIAKAKDMKSKGFGDSMFNMAFDNRTYDVFVRVRRMTNYEGEANQYEGQIILMSNDGKTVLDTKDIKGSCGC